MNDSIRNSAVRSETAEQEEGRVMSADNGTSASMMQPTVLTDLGLIYMLQQQHGGGGETAMMLSPGSLPLLMSSCQVMALHPGMSQQFVSSSSTGTSPSSLARSPILAHDGSIIWHPASTEDQLSDNFDDEHHQGTSFSQQQPHGTSGLTQQPASPANRNPITLQHNNHPQLMINGGMAGYPGYAVVNPASTVSHSSNFVASVQPKVVITTPPKTNLLAPKKPLTPYMKFSKSIWQHVKNANPSMSVCEVGASIGRLWREMSDTDKQKYNDEFQREKAVYEAELQSYLRATGLQAADLAKTKKKDPRDRSKSASNAVVTPVQNVVATALSHPNPATSAAGQDTDTEGARLPHFAQMWSGHSVPQQQHAVISRVQSALKSVCDPFDLTRSKSVETSTRSQQERETILSPNMTAVSTETPSGMPWAWIKAIEPNNPNRSFPVVALDSSQSAYIQQDQGSLNFLTTPGEQQHSMEAYASSDGLEPGEVVVEGLDQTSLSKVITSHSGSMMSAHNMYNSYAVNPWNQYKLTAGRQKTVEAIFDKEQILKTELIHLRGSLSEKTKEVEQLMKELETAYALISKLQQQDPSQSQSVSHSAQESVVHEGNSVKDGSLVNPELGHQPTVLGLAEADQKHVNPKDMESVETTSMVNQENRGLEQTDKEMSECKQETNHGVELKETELEMNKVVVEVSVSSNQSCLPKELSGICVSKQDGHTAEENQKELRSSAQCHSIPSEKLSEAEAAEARDCDRNITLEQPDVALSKEKEPQEYSDVVHQGLKCTEHVSSEYEVGPGEHGSDVLQQECNNGQQELNSEVTASCQQDLVTEESKQPVICSEGNVSELNGNSACSNPELNSENK